LILSCDVVCVNMKGEVHCLRRDVSMASESSDVSGGFWDTCTLVSLCLSLPLTVDKRRICEFPTTTKTIMKKINVVYKKV